MLISGSQKLTTFIMRTPGRMLYFLTIERESSKSDKKLSKKNLRFRALLKNLFKEKEKNLSKASPQVEEYMSVRKLGSYVLQFLHY